MKSVPDDFDIISTLKPDKAYFDCIIAPFFYVDGARDAMINMKFHSMRDNSIYFGEKMYEVFSEKFSNDFDGILYVPTTKARLKDRGFNSSLVLAEKFSEKSGIPVIHDTLVRSRKSRTQHDLSFSERLKNAEESYYPSANIPHGGKYILADDICTSGATLNHICRILKENGVKEIVCIIACTGKP